MGTYDGSSTGSVIQHLLDQPQAFNLFQAISLLEAELLRDGDCVVEDRLRLRSRVSLAFQPSDIYDVEWTEDGDRRFTLWSSVMGLAGAGGALPLVFTEMLLERTAKKDHATAEFLDIFNQRFLYFLYGSRRKGQPGLGVLPLQTVVPRVLESIGSLGINPSIPRAAHTPLWLRHAGLMGGSPSSMTGLLALLRDRLALRIQGRQFVGQWLAAETVSLARLDGRPALDGSAVLGSRVWDQAAGIALEIAIDCAEQLRNCLPGGQTYQLLKALIATYVRQELSVTLLLAPTRKAITPPRLAMRSNMRLGWTARLPRSTTEPDKVRLKLQTHDF